MIPRDERQDWGYKRHDSLGYNFRMSSMQAALGMGQLERLDYLVAARRYIASQYDAVIKDTKCEWLIPPFSPEGVVHSYFSYPIILNEKAGIDWHTFRNKYIEFGGDGLYGMCSPVHLEPIFQTMTFYGSPDRAPHFDARYKGGIKNYREGDCPNVESFQKHIFLFKTGMQTLDKIEREVDALQATIEYYT